MEKIKCSICGKEYKNINSLTRHYYEVHNLTREEVYSIYHSDESKHICKYCGKEVKLDNRKLIYSDFCSSSCTHKFQWENKSEEEKLAYKNKIRRYWDNISEEDKLRHSENKKRFWQSRSEEIKLKHSESHKKSWQNKSEESILERTAKIKFTWQNKSEEEKKEFSNKKKSEWENRSEEDLYKFSKFLFKMKGKDLSFEKYQLFHNKEKLKNFLIEYKQQHGIYPTPNMLTEYFGFENASCITPYIHKYGLSDYILWYNSSIEREIYNYIKEIYDGKILKDSRKILANNKEIDIYIPKNKLAIEFNGNYWHSNLYLSKNYHQNKSKECMINGIHLIHIFEDEWVSKQEKIKNLIKSSLGLYDNVINFKDCVIKELNTETYKDFIEKYSLYDYKKVDVVFGVYYGDDIIQVVSFDIKKYRIIQNITKFGYNIINGFEGVLHYFIEKYIPKEITWCVDFSKCNIIKGDFIFNKLTKPHVRYKREIKKCENNFEVYDSGDMEMLWKIS